VGVHYRGCDALKRRYLVFLAFFIFLYIGPVNFAPYDVPSAIVERPQEPKEIVKGFSRATDYDVVVAADGDDDTWDYTGGSYVHFTANTEMWTSDPGGDWFVSSVRFPLAIPKDATIDSAVLHLYETADNGGNDAEIFRIDESNVGDLEADGSFPAIDYTEYGQWDFDGVASEWQSADVATLVQTQIDLVDWESGFYIGFNFNQTVAGSGSMWKFEEFSHANSNHAYLNVTYAEAPPLETTEWFTDNIVGYGWNPANSPSAWYDVDTDRTYVTFEGDLEEIDGDGDLDPHILYYDHVSGMWSNTSWVAYNPLNDWPPPSYSGDKHGPPSMWVDNDGYIHVLFGAHASQVIQHVVSDSPDDISSFSNATDPCTATWNPSYPHVHYDSVDNVTHLFYRGYTDGRYIVYQNSTDNGDTWSDPQTIVYMGVTEGISNRPYMGMTAFSDNEMLHISFHNHSMYDPAISGAEHDFFYVQFNVTNGHVYNASGSDFGEMADPDEVQNCRFYEYPVESGTRSGVPDLYLDNENNPWIFYFVGNDEIYVGKPAPTTGLTLRYAYWNSSANDWQGANITEHWVSGSSAAAIAWTSDNITMWATKQADEMVYEWSWDGSTWTDQGVIDVNNTYSVSWPIVPENYKLGNHTELQLLISEYEGGAVPFDGKCKGWAYGSEGILGRSYGSSIPVNEQTPTCSNLDDTDNLYSMYREYEITVNVSDADGFSDIDYLTLSLYDYSRRTLYWSLMFEEDTATFSESLDTSNMISLNETCLLYTSPSPRDRTRSRMPSSA